MTTTTQPHITEQKSLWYEVGVEYENQFVGEVCPRLGLDISINPDKEVKPWACDLLVNNKTPADLKRQTQPFFSAHTKYGMPSQYTVTFNKKDIINYYEKYDPNTFELFFWVSWGDEKRFGTQVNKMHGVWQCWLKDIMSFAKDCGATWHNYERRGAGDTHNNATTSLLLDLRWLNILYYNGYGLPYDIHNN